MALCQLSPNRVRVVLGGSALNKLLGVNLTQREIFWCYSLCHYPQDKSRYYFQARIGAPDLVKCLTKSEKGYHEGIVIVGGAWDDGDINQIRWRMYDNVSRDVNSYCLAISFSVFVLSSNSLFSVQFAPNNLARIRLILIPSIQLSIIMKLEKLGLTIIPELFITCSDILPLTGTGLLRERISLIGLVPLRGPQNLKIDKELSPGLYLEIPFQLGL